MTITIAKIKVISEFILICIGSVLFIEGAVFIEEKYNLDTHIMIKNIIVVASLIPIMLGGDRVRAKLQSMKNEHEKL